MDIARRAGCDAVHPGYGFLAENAALPRACTDAGLTFIGPPADAMESLGSKTAGRQLARRVDVPTVPGTNDPSKNPAKRKPRLRWAIPFCSKRSPVAGARVCASSTAMRIRIRIP